MFSTDEIAAYKSMAEVDQLSMKDEVLRTYKFVGVFPTKLGQIDLDWNDENVEVFDCTFAVDYYYVSASASGDFAGE